jgi:hypothetical protein
MDEDDIDILGALKEVGPAGLTDIITAMGGDKRSGNLKSNTRNRLIALEKKGRVKITHGNDGNGIYEFVPRRYE